MRAKYSQERRDRIGELNKNKSLSKETIEKLRESSLNRKKLIYSEEGLLNMKKRSKELLVFNLDGTLNSRYFSIKKAAESLQCNVKTISRILKTEKKILKKR